MHVYTYIYSNKYIFWMSFVFLKIGNEETKINFQFETNMIVVTVFLLIMNKIDFHLAYNQKENGHYDHFTFIFQ